MTGRRMLIGLFTILATVLTVGGVASAGGGGGAGAGGVGTTQAAADLQITGSASTRAPDPGSSYSYTFLIKNSGGSTASGVVLSNPIPPGTVPNFATSQGSILPCAAFGDLTGGTTYRCDVGTIVKGGQATVVVSVTAPQTARIITDTATVTATTLDPSLANNSATVTVAVKAPTGGVCKGGVCDLVPPPVGTPCAVLTSVSAPVGYYSIWAAVWNDFTIQSCSTGTQSLTVEVTETNVSTGTVDYDVVWPTSLLPSQNLSMVLDNDFAAYSTTYQVAYSVRDSSGTLMTTSSATATTPGPQ